MVQNLITLRLVSTIHYNRTKIICIGLILFKIIRMENLQHSNSMDLVYGLFAGLATFCLAPLGTVTTLLQSSSLSKSLSERWAGEDTSTNSASSGMLSVAHSFSLKFFIGQTLARSSTQGAFWRQVSKRTIRI